MPIDIDFLKSQLVDIENERKARTSRTAEELDGREKEIRVALAEAEVQQSRDEGNVTESGRAALNEAPKKTEAKTEAKK